MSSPTWTARSSPWIAKVCTHQAQASVLLPPAFTFFFGSVSFFPHIQVHVRLTFGLAEFVVSHLANIRRAASYVQRHVNKDMLYFEDPALAGADDFALKVTYWKDSELPNWQTTNRASGEFRGSTSNWVLR